MRSLARRATFAGSGRSDSAASLNEPPSILQGDEEILKPALKLAGAPMDAEIHTFELLHLVTP